MPGCDQTTVSRGAPLSSATRLGSITVASATFAWQVQHLHAYGVTRSHDYASRWAHAAGSRAHGAAAGRTTLARRNSPCHSELRGAAFTRAPPTSATATTSRHPARPARRHGPPRASSPATGPRMHPTAHCSQQCQRTRYRWTPSPGALVCQLTSNCHPTQDSHRPRSAPPPQPRACQPTPPLKHPRAPPRCRHGADHPRAPSPAVGSSPVQPKPAGYTASKQAHTPRGPAALTRARRNAPGATGVPNHLVKQPGARRRVQDTATQSPRPRRAPH